jgi:cytochrome P450
MTNVTPSASLVRNAVHQTMTLLFASQDTTATLVQWLCYEMYKNPELSYHLCEVHDLVFGPGTSSAAEKLR